MVTGFEEVVAASIFRANEHFSQTLVIIHHTTSETTLLYLLKSSGGNYCKILKSYKMQLALKS